MRFVLKQGKLACMCRDSVIAYFPSKTTGVPKQANQVGRQAGQRDSHTTTVGLPKHQINSDQSAKSAHRRWTDTHILR
eukprot:7824399-Alexandrium_andersonii.AAC.1